MSEQKNELRREMLALRRTMSENVRKEYDERIYNNLVNLPQVQNSRTFLVYASSGAEVDTRRFINKMLEKEKTVAVPKCVGKQMIFLRIASLDELVRSSFGVDEPLNGEEITEFEGSVCIVPALRFDRDGYRLGWGGGFYDRFLNDYTGYSVGICYEQCYGKVPRDTYDVNTDIVIIENGIYKKTDN